MHPHLNHLLGLLVCTSDLVMCTTDQTVLKYGLHFSFLCLAYTNIVYSLQTEGVAVQDQNNIF